MILKRIRNINNTGQFFKTTMNSPAMDKDFTKVSLIYGPNGFGKSTLSEIIRSLKENDGTIITSKRSIPEKGDPYIKFSFAQDFNGKGGETPIEYSGTKWSATVDNLEIFDCKFISENIYSDFEITHEHKKKISALILGDAGVSIAKEIEEIQKNINEVRKEQSDLLGKIALCLPKKFVGRNDVFIAIPETEKSKIANKAKLEKSLKTVLEAEKVQKLTSPEEMVVTFDLIGKEVAEIEKVLGLSQATMSAEIAEKVQTHIASNLDDRGEDWLRKGLSYHNSKDVCPFCTQKTDGADVKEIISSYTKFFSDEYEAYVNKIKSDTGSLVSGILRKTTLISTLDSIFVRNNLAVNKAKDYIEETIFNDTVTSFTKQETEIKTQYTVFIASVQELKKDIDTKVLSKTQRPLSPVELQAFNRVDLLTKETALNKAIEKYNTIVASTTTVIKDIKKSTTTEKQADIEKELLVIETVEARFSNTVIGLISTLDVAKIKLGALDKKREVKEGELVSHNKIVAEKYLKEANGVLKSCGCRFSIRAPEDFSRRGASPVIDLGFKLLGIDIDGKKFGDILSESDKRCLAFSLFIAKLNTDDAALKDKIVVLDDPFTSLDDNRQDNTIFQIKKLENKCAQIIVLCHYSQPMAELANDFKGSLQISIENTPTKGSFLIEEDLFDKLRNNKHLCRLDKLQNVLDNTIPNDQFPSIRATVRNVLEYEIRSRFRPNFVGFTKYTLGELITELETQTKANKAILKGSKPDEIILELRHINSKTALEHHGDPSDTNNTDNIQNLRGLISQTFEVVYEKL